ncbi:acyl-CoA reductase-like NAD-dependent aldehyde dehydrogenase [Kribbella sp. VKM Ac-2527]|uniref:Acyl-CoA reductase-like NAD-dependent aldehyde dehydrogenase n=1 Tax=Kribbella caucasensis TaxID=2512215 RepID=A0A4R6KK27_9ACTN|nr:aldehyde dehydrogenase [Kribbella sp. VKM Ac-2527]TDO51674.1 acyl-CoA reductase-like NAD-dependent aldehyde dehydrogenase [Kribbella sp. VKM Ac-2527]
MTTDLLTSHETLFIDGQWVPAVAQERIEVVSPWTEKPIASVPSASREDVDRAVGAARRAFESGPWPAMSLADRMAIVARLRDLLVKHSDQFAQLITDEMGCPITQSQNIQVTNPVGILESYLEVAAAYPFREIRHSRGGQALVTREPVGVVAGVVPWNVPLSLTIQKVIPALLTGCTVVLKPAPETPLDAYLVAELLIEAGLPPGVVNVVPADRAISEYLVSHPDVAKVTFTGSSAAGRRIAEICGRDLRKVTLELGGKSAAVILDDADLDIAVSALRLGAFRNNGQICSLKTRLVVPRPRQTELLERLDALVDSMPVGDPNDPATHIGPLVSQRQRARVEGYIEAGLGEGARLVRGGGRPADLDHGWFVEPTIFANVDPDATIAQEEIFGPVLSVIPYDAEDHAIAIANNSQYGLNGSVFTTDIDRGLRVAAQIHTGTVELNGNPAGFHAPMGGVKASGLGREFGPEGLEPFVETKAIGIPADLAVALQ